MIQLLRDRRFQALLVVAIAIGLAFDEDAWGRVGGGQGFSSGGGSRSSGGGGGSSSGGGSSGDGDAIVFLIWLVIRYPHIGIPVLIVLGIIVAMNRGARGFQRVPHSTSSDAYVPPPHPARADPTRRLRATDPTFSTPVLLDQLQVLFRRALEASVTKRWDPLAPFVGEGLRTALEREAGDATAITEVVLAQITIAPNPRGAPTPLKGGGDLIAVEFEGTRAVTSPRGVRHEYFKEEWQLVRPAGVHSPAPDVARRLGCPSCGNAIETDAMGRCRSCETPITNGRLSWLAVARTPIVAPRPITPPDVARSPGGEEPGYSRASAVDAELGHELRAFQGRHPDWSPKAFDGKVADVYLRLQAAWSEGRWEGARPYVTDTLFQTLRFWMDGYARAGLRNRLDDVKLENTRIVKVEQDAWYESITVRIWGSMKDSVVDGVGNVVGGNANVDRKFSEYWTFVRAAGKPAGVKPNDKCPSCGAALDRVGETGVCGYCEAKITGGDFDWVLSRIEQAEVYGQ